MGIIPNAKVTKRDGRTGVTTPGSKGICAVIAPCSAGTANRPEGMSKVDVAVTEFGQGVLTEFGGYLLDETGNPCVLVKASPSTPGAYGTFTQAGTGTSVASAGASTPYDDYNVLVTVVAGGIVGTTGITYRYSLDGGTTQSAVQALGTATEIDIPNSGVAIALSHSSSNTLVAGDTIAVPTTGPRLTTDDISAALEALRTSALPWECVLVAGHDATNATVTLLDTWLAAREAEGRYRFFVVNARMKNAGETEGAYATAMATAFGQTASIRGCVCADGGDLVSVLPGRAITLKRQTSLALAGRTMAIPYGEDPAYVQEGPIAGFKLADDRGNPNNHDENLYPGLDALRLVTLRTFDRKQGTFITNANVISSEGSDFVYVQHIRTMNRGCELAFDVLTNQLSRGVQKNPKPGPNGEIYIAEEDAARIEALVNQALNELKGQVTDLRFVLSRTDDIGSNGPVTLNGQLEVESLAYVKEFDTNASFVRSISVQG